MTKQLLALAAFLKVRTLTCGRQPKVAFAAACAPFFGTYTILGAENREARRTDLINESAKDRWYFVLFRPSNLVVLLSYPV